MLKARRAFVLILLGLLLIVPAAWALYSQTVVYSLSTRTSAPSASDAVDLQSKGSSRLVARLRVTANGGTADQRLVLQRQDATDGATWLDAEGDVLIFDATQASAGSTYRDTKMFVPSSRYTRWSPTHTGTTASLTWELVESYQ